MAWIGSPPLLGIMICGCWAPVGDKQQWVTPKSAKECETGKCHSFLTAGSFLFYNSQSLCLSSGVQINTCFDATFQTDPWLFVNESREFNNILQHHPDQQWLYFIFVWKATILVKKLDARWYRTAFHINCLEAAWRRRFIEWTLDLDLTLFLSVKGRE